MKLIHSGTNGTRQKHRSYIRLNAAAVELLAMFCSTIIPTINRPELSRAIFSVLDQEFDRENFEVIVVNDSGKPLPDAQWMKSSRVREIHTNRRNRSVARNAGAAIAKGKYLHFLDDDDWMMPGAFEHFWELANSNHAKWLYGAFRMVDNAGYKIAEIFPDEVGNCLMQVLAWEWLPLQASIIESKAFFAVGGFSSLDSLLGGFEDIDLSRKIAFCYDVAGIPNVVTSIRIGDEGSTTNYVDMFRQNRQSRENTLSTNGVFMRMRDSANNNPCCPSYWYGKIFYYYSASIKWQLQHRQLLAAASRSVYALAGFISAGRHVMSLDYWRGALRPHYPRLGIVLQESGADYLYSNTRRKLGLSN